MKEPLEGILDRDMYCMLIKDHFGDTLDLVSELANYGSYLIPRCFGSGKRNLEDIVLVATMLKQSVSLVDSIDILCRNAAPTHGYVLLRSLWEMNIYTEWVMKEDTENRAAMYYVYDQRHQLRWALSMQEGTPESEIFRNGVDDAPAEFSFTRVPQDKIAVRPGGHVQTVQLTQDEINSVTDTTNPTVDANSQTETITLIPGGTLTFEITWETDVSSDPTLDRVTVHYPSGIDVTYPNPSRPETVTQEYQAKSGAAGYIHKMTIEGAPCGAGTHVFTVESATQTQTGSTASNQYLSTFCTSGKGDPHVED